MVQFLVPADFSDHTDQKVCEIYDSKYWNFIIVLSVVLQDLSEKCV